LGCFYFLALLNSQGVQLYVHVSTLVNMFSSLLSVCVEVELLGHTVPVIPVNVT
jgi:hypothetical protein